MQLTTSICKNLISKGRGNKKKLANNTYLIEEDGVFKVELHDNCIIVVYPDDSLKVSSCGWNTKTTKERLNEYTDLGIYQRKGQWYVASGSYFTDNMAVSPKTGGF